MASYLVTMNLTRRGCIAEVEAKEAKKKAEQLKVNDIDESVSEISDWEVVRVELNE